MRSILRGICSAATGALLAACGALPVPGSIAVTPRQTAATNPAPRSWISPDSVKGDLLYVSDASSGEVYVFSYPAGRHVGTLTGFALPQSLCSDRSGNVFITDPDGRVGIAEYAHGGTKRINSLRDRYYPIACSVDPTTGSLAVANQSGSVSIYTNAAGRPEIYSTVFIPDFAAYDDSGDLFVTNTRSFAIRIAELAKGSKAFATIGYRGQNNGEAAGLQWIGNHLAVGSGNTDAHRCCARIFDFVIKGSSGKRIATTRANGAMYNFFVEGQTAILTTLSHRVDFYEFPSGGSATKTIREPGRESFGVVVSLGQSQRQVGKPVK
jgi:hypothetical protein